MLDFQNARDNDRINFLTHS